MFGKFTLEADVGFGTAVAAVLLTPHFLALSIQCA